VSNGSNATERRPVFGRRDALWGLGGAAITTVAAVITTPSSTEVKQAAPPQAEEMRQKLDEAKRAEQRLLSQVREVQQKLDEARRREAGRQKAQSILRAPAWTELDLNAFLDSLPEGALLSLKKSLKCSMQQIRTHR